MRHGSHGFAIIELIFVIAFLALIAAAVIFVVDPLERARQEGDRRMRADGASIVQAVNVYLTSSGRLPWAQKLDGSVAVPGLAWTKVTYPEVGVCGDKSCSEGGVLVKTGALGASFLSRRWVTQDSHGVYIAKGKNPQDSIFVCFVPESHETRKSTGSLYVLEEGKSIPPSGLPTACSDDVSWHDDDVCYVCVAK